MKFNTNHSGTKVALGLAFLVTITLSMGLYSLQEITNLSAITARMYQHPLTVSNAVREVRADILAMHRSMKDVALSQDTSQLKKAVREVDLLEQDVFKEFDIIEERFLGDKGEVKTARRNFTKWKDIRDEVITLQKAGMSIQAARITTGKGADHIRTMDETIQRMIDFANQKGVQFFEDSNKKSKSIHNTMLILLTFAISAGLMVAFIITRTWRDTEQKNQSQEWLTRGAEELNIAIRGNQNLLELSTNIVTFLSQYVDAAMGAIYVKKGESEALLLCGGYAIDLRMTATTISMGEGMIGEALRSKRPLSLKEIPNSSFSIPSGAGNIHPRHLLAIPFLKDDTVTGIVEIGALSSFSAQQLEFLYNSMTSITSAITSCQARMLVSELLEESKLRTTQLEQQELKLIKANKELEHKSSELSQQRDEIEHHNADLLAVRSELEQRAEELTRTSRYKTEFLANMSHELRTPLNSLLILADLLCRDTEKNLSDKQLKSLHVIRDSGHELLALINEILDLAKIEAGHTEITLQNTQTSKITDQLHAMFDHVATKKGILFTVNTERKLPRTLHTDGLRLSQILKNIIGNAVKFTSKGFISVDFCRTKRQIRLRDTLFSPENSLTIVVRDSGIGISRANQEAIFEPFHQIDRSQNRGHDGTGLGLSISRELVHLLGGAIRLKSEAGKGSTFSIYLPLQSTKLPPPFPPSGSYAGTQGIDVYQGHEKKAPSGGPAPSLSGLRLLLVDDNVRNIYSLSRVLEEEKLTVVVAANGQQALDKIDQESPFDIVLMDIMMPIMDGYTAIRKIRAQDALSDLPIIALTAKAMSTDRAECIKAGANDFLAKPVNLTHLLAKIQQQVTPKDTYSPHLPTIFSTSPLARSIRPQTALSKT